jgi:hypothetical protein
MIEAPLKFASLPPLQQIAASLTSLVKTTERIIATGGNISENQNSKQEIE